MNDTIEQLREVEVLPQDQGLRGDVGQLGALVGEMLAEQEGDAFLEQVESLRQAAIRRRESDQSMDPLAAELAGLGADDAHRLTRAFSTYFQAVNLAERVHRLRRHRDYRRADAGPQPDSLRAVLAELKTEGMTEDAVAQWLQALDVEPVFTAHPTESVRRSLLEKEQAMAERLIAGFDPERPPVDRRRDRERLRMALTAGWQTSEASRTRPSVQDEFEHVGFHVVGPLYQVLPALYENLGDAWQRVHGRRRELPRVLRFASWVGGDMDGNPAVGADTLADTLAAQRDQILDRYIDECRHLARLLSQTRRRVTVADDVDRRFQQYTLRFATEAESIRPRHRDMPYRCLLTLMAARLEATRAGYRDGYETPDELEDDIGCVLDSLKAHHGKNAGAFAVQRFLWRVRTFGFHMMRLDVRQDARVHDDVLAVLLDDADWAERDSDARAERLRPCAAGETVLQAGDDPAVRRLHDVFAVLADSRRRYGVRATGPYIISMARSAADVLAVLALARVGGLVDDAGHVPLDVAPLFETVDDLEHAGESLRSLFEDPVYREHLDRRCRRQMIMLGYSDSSKDGGIVSSRWVLQAAQHAMLAVAREYDVQVGFFHGRGGSVSRGGGHLVKALMASPVGSVNGHLRMTEQGEVIHRKYGLRSLALRSLEQMVGATLRASVRPDTPRESRDQWHAIMAEMAEDSRAAYRELVRDPKFVDWFRLATPVDVIEHLAMSSRPASRRAMQGVEDLRAIPWVFAWTQSRAILTGWYGLGTAVERAIERHGLDTLQAMARDWTFFRTMIEDVEMVLAKTDLRLASRFSSLSGPLHEPFFSRVEREHQASVDAILRLKDADRLLVDDPRLALSIRLRNPYIDPMSLLQVDLLKRWRETGSDPEGELFAALVATINGVARGLQNTG